MIILLCSSLILFSVSMCEWVRTCVYLICRQQQREAISWASDQSIKNRVGRVMWTNKRGRCTVPDDPDHLSRLGLWAVADCRACILGLRSSGNPFLWIRRWNCRVLETGKASILKQNSLHILFIHLSFWIVSLLTNCLDDKKCKIIIFGFA